jgi:5-formyltetrahydrofolate cyclo-ligase
MKRDFVPSIPAVKEEVRRSMRLHLRTMDPAFRAEASLVICGLAAGLPAFKAATCVALFSPLLSEPDLYPLIEEAWARGKQVTLPRLLEEGGDARLEWRAVTRWEDVNEPGPFGVREPDPARCPVVDSGSLGCVFVPGLAFDDRGMRLGRGGGFYDRFLGSAPVALPRFGLMFGSQRVPTLPVEAHDQALPAIVTEDGMILFGEGGS